MNGVIVVDKPAGPTSFDMVARARRAAGVRRAGHAGTLDPMATGVLLVCLGEATKLSAYLMDADKEYRATVRLGQATDTDDADAGAQVVFAADAAALGSLREEAVRQQLRAMVGRSSQRPPRYSALKVEGQRLYQRARQGEDLSAGREREVRIDAIDIEEIALDRRPLPELRFRVRCGKGTYIRAIARDLGARLGVGGHLTALRRLRVGRFTPAEATELCRDPDRFAAPPRLFGLAEALAHLPQLTLASERVAERLRQGQRGALLELQGELAGLGAGPVAVLGPHGALLAIVTPGPEGWAIARGFGP